VDRQNHAQFLRNVCKVLLATEFDGHFGKQQRDDDDDSTIPS
jgi:hypothetical protein